MKLIKTIVSRNLILQTRPSRIILAPHAHSHPSTMLPDFNESQWHQLDLLRAHFGHLLACSPPTHHQNSGMKIHGKLLRCQYIVQLLHL